MMALWTVKQVAEILGCFGEFDETPITGVSIDTRTIKPGELFVALLGTPSGGFVSSFESKGDGHDWVKMAQDKGAAAAIVSRPVAGVTMPLLVVDDTLLDGLWALAAAARARLTGKVIGLTGSAGKSGTKEFLAGMLDGCFASPGSYNNFWGVPLTLCNTPPEAPFAVYEMGMNQPGEIERLTKLVQPDVALVVNVKPVHVEMLGSVEAIRLEKLAIRHGLTDHGVLVLPDEVKAERLDKPSQKLLRFGERGHVKATDWAADMSGSGEDWTIEADVDGVMVEALLRQGAPHRLSNALAALACCKAAGADVVACAARLEHVGVMAGRGVADNVAGVTVIDDSFNANPASVTAAIEALGSRVVTGGRRIAVLGDMLELGADEVAYHAGLAPVCAHLDGVVCVGPLMKNLYEALPSRLRLAYFTDPEALRGEDVAALLKKGDAVVVKGSKKIFYVHGFVGKLKGALRNA